MKLGPRRYGTAPIIALVFFAGTLFPVRHASAQAWVPGKGRGNVALSYQNTNINYHLFSTDLVGYYDPATGYAGGPDNRLAMGEVTGQSVFLSAEYGLLSRLALSTSITYESSRYVGLSPESPNDDGQYHGSMQDIFIGARYMLDWNDFAITPLAGYQFPSTDYNNFGHTAVGRGLGVGTVGLALGRTLAPALPRIYLQAAYTYAIIENVDEFNLDQNRLAGQVGYALTNFVTVGGAVSYSKSVDGVDWITDLSTPEDVNEHFGHHDIAAKETVTHAGAFISWAIPGGGGLSFSYLGTPAGENSHAANSFTVGTSWNFSTPWTYKSAY
jgi:hypothetical protein